jgi:branched-subunit amino acid transport protein
MFRTSIFASSTVNGILIIVGFGSLTVAFIVRLLSLGCKNAKKIQKLNKQQITFSSVFAAVLLSSVFVSSAVAFAMVDS